MFGLSFSMLPYFVYGGNKGSVENALCTGLSEPLLLANVISTKVSCIEN